MHVLIIPSWYPEHREDVKGVFFRDQALALVEHGHKVGVISTRIRPLVELFKNKTRDARISYELDNNIPTYRNSTYSLLPKIPYGAYFFWRRATKKSLKKYVKEHGKPDIIHAHSAIYAGAAAVELGSFFRIPVVLTEHSTSFALRHYRQWQINLARKAAKESNARIAVSPSLAKLLNKNLGNNWETIPNVVARRFFDFESKKGNPADSITRILNLSLMTEKKGHINLLKAFDSAFPAPSKVELWLGGDGPIRSQLESLAISLGIKHRINFLGLVKPTEVPLILQQIDILAIASRIETFGLVAAEALVCGIPVVATRCGGPEHIVGENDGLLVQPDSPQELAEALKTVANNLPSYDAQSIRQRASARFSRQAVASNLSDLYKLVLESYSVK